jgi:hypothetical protein
VGGGIQVLQELTMTTRANTTNSTTSVDTNPAKQPTNINNQPTTAPSKPGKAETPLTPEHSKVDQFAGQMAKKGTKTEQNFDKDNSNLFSK